MYMSRCLSLCVGALSVRYVPVCGVSSGLLSLHSVPVSPCFALVPRCISAALLLVVFGLVIVLGLIYWHRIATAPTLPCIILCYLGTALTSVGRAFSFCSVPFLQPFLGKHALSTFRPAK